MATSMIPLPASSSNSAINVQPVSASLVPARMIASIPWWGMGVLVTVGMALLFMIVQLEWWAYVACLVPLALVAQSIALKPRRTRALGYLVRENDIVFREGLLNRSVTILPFGRIQDMEIHEGLIERRFGIVSLTLRTASGFLSGMTIPGLERAEAERIRDIIAREAHEKMAAL